mmetsp:Transcript_36440/g.117413  ORF Transcript_36440/g.117413 Transcript_36440/m.117413 type:complete len:324 (-) Transcript_36440:301-1272(-)
MVVIGRFLLRAMSCGDARPAWRACFRPRAEETRERSWASLAPSRIASRNEISEPPNRHTLSEPSAVSRSRLQPPQKGSVIDEMKETEPSAPGQEKVRATSCASVRRRRRPGWRCESAASSSADGTSFASDQSLSSNGMNSMKRTSMGRARARAAKASTSCSFTPRITTQFSLSGLYPSASASSTARSTFASASRRVSSRKRPRCSVSSERLSLSRPAACSEGSNLDKATPLVVIAIWRSPSGLSPSSAPTTAARSGRTVGSPPVRRILSTPARTKRAARRSSSSAERSRRASVSDTPSAGMQYVQRSEQRSVSEMRRYVWRRP